MRIATATVIPIGTMYMIAPMEWTTWLAARAAALNHAIISPVAAQALTYLRLPRETDAASFT